VFSVGGARVVGVLIASATFPYLVRRLGVETYGLWNYVIAVCAFVQTVANPGFTTYLSQQVAAHRQDAFHLIPDVLAMRLLALLVGLVGLLVVSSFEARADVRLLLRVYGPGVLFVDLCGSDYLLGSLEMFHARSLLAVVQQALYGASVFAFVRLPKDVIWVPIGILSSSLLTSIAGWVLLWKRGFKVGVTIKPTTWKGILWPSLHYAAASLMSTV
jgi:O-antigen/teichoic acid export membrane protein